MSKSKRRSSLMPFNHGGPNQTPTIVVEQSDVAEEEVERRGRLKLQKRQSLGHISAVDATPVSAGKESAAVAATPTAVSGYSASQLAELYTNCMKLSAENKINVKNAFHLQLIDYMAEMVKTKKRSDIDNFQAASCALDASAKIYAYRVDSVHSDTLKLAGGVGKSQEEGKSGKADKNSGDAGMGDGDMGDDADDEQRQKKATRKKRSATIEKNVANISINKFDLEFDVDPLFKKTSAQFDSGGGGGQFLCNLFIRDESCQLMLDSDAFPNLVSRPLDPDSTKPLDKAKDGGLVKKVEDGLTICPTFDKFSFRNWSLEDEDPNFLNLSLKDDSGDEEEDKDVAGGDDEHEFDVNAPPVVDDFDDAMDNMDDDILPGDATTTKSVGLGVELISNLRQNLTGVPNEYSYFDHGRLGAWAGPKHWKFKPLSRPGKSFVNSQQPEEKKKRRNEAKVAVPYAFEDMYDEVAFEAAEKATTVPKKPIKLQTRTMVQWSDDKLTLPADLHYRGKDFAKLFVAADYLVTEKGVVVDSQSVDDSINDYDFDNAVDADEFCPSAVAADQADAYDEDAGFFATTQNTIVPTQPDLVSAPNKVEKINIGYAKQAKKMDMRKLKAVEWSLMHSFSENKENDEKPSNEAVADGKEVLAADLQFADLYRGLSTTKMMSAKMSENLSVPLAFVALLHLCNERCLSLDGREDFSDFSISQG